MDLQKLDPQLRSVFRFAPNAPVTNRVGLSVIQAVTQVIPGAKVPLGMRRDVITLANGQSVRIFTPNGGGNGAALLNIHGGGMVIGSASQDDGHMIEIAAKLGVTVVSVEYRLAPKHPFPAPLDDCHFAWQWLHSAAGSLGIDPARIAIGGQSAGGGLAAALVQRLHDEGGVQPAAQLLFCPMLDDRTAARRELDDEKHFVWNNRANLAGWSAYLGKEPGGTTTPAYASPSRRDDLAGLPTTWIGCGDVELFFDEDRTYAESLVAAGVDCTLDVVPGAPHAFETLAGSTALAFEYKARAHAWLRAALGL